MNPIEKILLELLKDQFDINGVEVSSNEEDVVETFMELELKFEDYPFLKGLEFWMEAKHSCKIDCSSTDPREDESADLGYSYLNCGFIYQDENIILSSGFKMALSGFLHMELEFLTT